MSPPKTLTLVSHALCPYVQRAAIVLLEKGVPFERRWVDLADKPAWFTAVSPLGRTPVLLVDDTPVFESAVICEYLDETLPPRLHPGDALQRARERGWMEFGSATLDTIARYYNAPDGPALDLQRRALEDRFSRLEQALDPDGPWFAGERFGLVDAVFGPVFRYFDTLDRIADFGMLADKPRLAAWRHALAQRPSVARAVKADYPERLWAFLESRSSQLSALMSKQAA